MVQDAAPGVHDSRAAVPFAIRCRIRVAVRSAVEHRRRPVARRPASPNGGRCVALVFAVMVVLLLPAWRGAIASAATVSSGRDASEAVGAPELLPDLAAGPEPGAEIPTPPPGAGSVAPGARYAWPLLPPPAVRTSFDDGSHQFGPGHRGVDLAGTAGQAVLAAEEGVVVHAGPLAGRGVVSVLHQDGLRTTYEPVAPTVAVGAVVARGAVLGALQAGHTGCPATCLHWGVRRDRLDYLDPLVLLRPPHVRLLPVPDPWPL